MGWNNNIFSLLIVTSGSGFTGLFAYSPGPGPGNLVASVTSHAGTDPFGNAYVAGIASYASNPAINSEMTAGALRFNEPVNASAAVIGSNSSAVLAMSSGQVNASDVEAIFDLLPALTGAVATAFLQNSSLELEEVAVPAADGSVVSGPKLFGNTSGHAGVVADTRNGDGNTYDVERLFLRGTALPQPFTSTTAATITGCSKTNIGLGRYRYKAYISFHGAAAAGTARFCIAGSLVTSSFDIAAMFITNTGVANNGTSATFGTGGFVQSPTLTTGANIAYIEGEFVVSTAGSVLLQAFEGTTGDAFTVDNCKFDLFPVVAS